MTDLPKGWTVVPLGEVVAEAQPGFASGENLDEGGVFQFRMNNLARDGGLDFSKKRRVPFDQAKSERFLLRPGDVLFNATNSPEMVGKCAYFDGHEEPAVFSNHFLRLRPGPSLEGRFLARWLQLQFQRGVFAAGCRKWVNQATYGKDSLLDLRIPLPPLEEQRRIAAILDKADELRAKRRAALDQLDTLTQSIFLDMFGDPVDNPLGWARLPLGSLLSSIDSGRSPVCLKEPAPPGEWGVLKLGAVTFGRFDRMENKRLPTGIAPDVRHEVKAGDVLFCRKNTEQLVGSCVYVHNVPPRLLLSDLIFRLQIAEPGLVTPQYLVETLQSQRMKRVVQSLATGAAASMPNISKQKLSSVAVPVPGLEIQIRFDQACQIAEESRRNLRRGVRETEALFVALQARAFRGKLSD